MRSRWTYFFLLGAVSCTSLPKEEGAPPDTSARVSSDCQRKFGTRAKTVSKSQVYYCVLPLSSSVLKETASQNRTVLNKASLAKKKSIGPLIEKMKSSYMLTYQGLPVGDKCPSSFTVDLDWMSAEDSCILKLGDNPCRESQNQNGPPLLFERVGPEEEACVGK